ncbi:L-seryl-tRNA(Sec) selenium transferase [Fredinandcohnia quinoae]|uniref:L-seryl-tRNA(Sec) selenium transferase n=1 Tax=Fredinandcohnia quinoae TaxID=2918902 RepID=A0AAW5DYD5_9BACI|nr:L-seryl-tRNA(Sec) selenium transferase [Fredinandcohnia sp. SECRCQ15]MCH1625650.1 L-seryl-tRNA(Sec) selenium transferase [Fredinandcohnia sp. SECRCQ15]
MKEYLRKLPSIHKLQKHMNYRELILTYKVQDKLVTAFIQESLQSIRNQIINKSWENDNIDIIDHVFQDTEQKLIQLTSFNLTNVINATGTVLHTNLGRARLSDVAIEHVVKTSRNYSNLEYDLEQGNRGTRHNIVENLIREVTGAEAAMVVNNNAAAVYLILRALSNEKEVIVSRGQLVEIGGSFRVSAIMEESGARLIEVGTTNKTHLFDYEQAITEETAMILKVHTSNFKTIGFTKTVGRDELVTLREHHNKLIIYEDLGSGVLFDFKKHDIGDEPVVSSVLKAGVDIVSFSGDKLLGGPQAGIIAGKREVIERLKKHQLARVLRVDKMSYAALEGTLVAYLKGDEQIQEIPTIRDILVTKEEIKKRCEKFIDGVKKAAPIFICELREDISQVGGGTMPDVELPTFVVALTHHKMSAIEIWSMLKNGGTPIITRIKNEEVLLDFRTITDNEINFIIEECVKMM